MKKYLSRALLLVVGVSCMQASAQTTKIKEGDKLSYAFADYAAKGREVSLEAERQLAVAVTEKDAFYTLKSDLSTSVYQRKNHVLVSRETPQGVKAEFSPDQQFNWMPPQGDFSKPWATSFAISHPQCGTGKVTHEATAKPIKYMLQIAGKATEIAAVEINFVGKWDFNNQCRSGKQLERFVYAPELDFWLERDQQNFNAQGFLNRGNNVKLKSVN